MAELTGVYVNICTSRKFNVLAVCDCELLGRVLHDSKIVFEIREDFYKGRKVTVEEALELCKQSSVVNMVGKRIVAGALKKGLIHHEAILEIEGIPHAQILKI